MYFLVQMEIGEGIQIMLGFLKTASHKKALERLMRFLKTHGFKPKIQDSHIALDGEIIIHLIKVHSLGHDKEPIEIAKKFLAKK